MSKSLTAKVDGQQKQISRLTDKVMERSKALEQAEKANKRLKRAFEMSRQERGLIGCDGCYS